MEVRVELFEKIRRDHEIEGASRHALERLMGNIHREEPQHRAAIDELPPDTEVAFAGPSFWKPFAERVKAAGIPRACEWLDGTGRLVEDQFQLRGPRSARTADMPLSSSPLEALLDPIRAAIKPRAYGLKNRERTNRMLMLMQPHANRQDDVRSYVRRIPDPLETNRGRPAIARRAVADDKGSASLR